MPYQIPAVPVADLSQDALTRHLAEATEAHKAAFALATEANENGTLDVAMLDNLDAIAAFNAAATERLATFSATTDSAPESEPNQEELAKRLASFGQDDKEPEVPGIADVTKDTTIEPPAGTVEEKRFSLVASASIGSHAVGETLDEDNATDMLWRHLKALATHSGSHRSPVFSINRAPTDFVANGDRSDIAMLKRLVDQSRLSGGSLQAQFDQAKSLTASSGWCAPSTMDYGIRTTYAADGLLSLPSMSAPRGGVFVMPELQFTTVNGGYANTTAFNLTEVQVAAGVPKNFVEMDCPTPAETRLAVDGLGVIGNLLQLRAYPEYVREFINGAQIALRHYENALHIARIGVLAGAATNLAADPLWLSDGSVWAQTMAAIDMAATDMRALKRMPRTATIEVLLPEWWIPQVRADLARRANIVENWKQDAWIISCFSAINVVPQFLKDYQDAYTTAGVSGPGTAVANVQLPTTLEFIIYPPGTFALAQLPVIDVSAVYDATRLAGNQRIEMFHEVGYAIVQLLAHARKYSLNICPTGKTGIAEVIDCTTRQPT